MCLLGQNHPQFAEEPSWLFCRAKTSPKGFVLRLSHRGRSWKHLLRNIRRLLSGSARRSLSVRCNNRQRYLPPNCKNPPACPSHQSAFFACSCFIAVCRLKPAPNSCPSSNNSDSARAGSGTPAYNRKTQRHSCFTEHGNCSIFCTN